jgi:hypothetical protein
VAGNKVPTDTATYPKIITFVPLNNRQFPRYRPYQVFEVFLTYLSRMFALEAPTRTNTVPLQRMFPDGLHRSAIASANPTRYAAAQVKFQHGQFPEPLPRQVHLDAALGRWALERHTFDAAMPQEHLPFVLGIVAVAEYLMELLVTFLAASHSVGNIKPKLLELVP